MDYNLKHRIEGEALARSIRYRAAISLSLALPFASA